MSDTLWTTVFAIGASQGVFLCAVLMMRRASNRAATRLLAAIVGIFTLMILSGAMTQNQDAPLRSIIMFLNINRSLRWGLWGFFS